MVKFLIVLFVLFTVGISSASAQPPTSFSFGFNVYPVRQSPVEQYLPTVVTNTTFSHTRWGCSWDVDDNSDASAYGKLSPGQTVSFTVCQVIESFNSPFPSSCIYDFDNARGCGYPVEIGLYSDSPSVTATLCFSPGPCFAPQSHYDQASKMYLSRACVRAVYPYGDPLDVPIEGSGGGHGVLTDETITVTNPTSRAVKYSNARFSQIGWGQGAGGVGPISYPSPVFCYQDNTDQFTDGIFRWRAT